ncbi:MAG: 3-phosphoshikimate 1-carboxyvinyltransferase [Clostridiales bacterium]|nr:3-phosphoshikimate 1-carboxyvinyltransferase [Clostridiales bacterium]
MDYQVKTIYGKIKNRNAVVKVPGSKSITARALLLAALADGESVLYGAQLSDDCATFIEAVKMLGIGVEIDGTTVKVQGCGGRLPVRKAEIYVGSAGTAARFLTAMLALSEGEFELTSSAQMQKRPQADLIAALKTLGAHFTFHGEVNCFPFTVRGTKRAADEVTVDITKSSQFLSALLMAGVLAGKPLTVKTAGSHGMDYVNMTLDMMWSFGVSAEESRGAYTVSGGYSAKKYDIEPDISAACYFYAANRLLGTDIKVAGVFPHTMQGDIKFVNLIKDFNGGRVDMSAFSDQTLTLAAVAPYLENPTEITGVSHIRGQECDRIAAIVHNLSAMGVKVEERDDGVKIYPCKSVRGAEIETFGDHRVAMAFSLCGLMTDGIIIKNAEVCSKTFKEYFETLDNLIARITT